MNNSLYTDLKKRLLQILISLMIIIVLGTITYKYLGGDDWSVLDAFYMTIITITTVGFREVHSLHAIPEARIFTVLLALFGMGFLLYGMGNLTAFIIEGDLKNLMWRQRTMKQIKKMKNHLIVCGIGEIGIHIVEELFKIRKEFVVIEANSVSIENCKFQGKIPIIEGDATDDDTLIAAGIENAAGIISSLHSDKDNLFITVSARQLNPSIRIVAHAIDPTTQKKLQKSGANAVVSANVIGALRMVSEMVRPAVVNFLDQMLRYKDKTVRIEEVTIKEGSRYIGKNIAETHIGKETGVLIIALRNVKTKQFTYSFSQNLKLQVNDILVVIGSVEQIEKLRKKTNN